MKIPELGNEFEDRKLLVKKEADLIEEDKIRDVVSSKLFSKSESLDTISQEQVSKIREQLFVVVDGLWTEWL